ncbi:hypothetical protein [Salmonella phage PST_H2]|uniref:Uncharacterized protein n=1 Tax=Salmonella phage PST_H2 TaxID=2978975 RepID=A0A977TGQ2_9CAUD|nr:hypothetical protein [Salmonella phage PST_H2]
MYKLVLNVGDYVRNINETSRRYRCRGMVDLVSGNVYRVMYADGIKACYRKEGAHKYLEKIGNVSNQCKCVHDEVCDNGVHRTTLKKERRNVITGKTQSEMIKQCGTALGVSQFNTRSLGKSTGQAMVKIGEAMMHPNVPVRIVDVDHAITEHGTPRHVANKNFAAIVNHIIKKQGLLGFIINESHLVYCPIVTEETYVNL